MSNEGSDDDEVGDPQMPVIRRSAYSYGRNPVNYAGDRMTESARKMRTNSDPYTQPKTSGEMMFWILFHQDYYSVKTKITHDAQYIDWEYMRKKNNAIFNEVINAYAEKKIKHIMGFLSFKMKIFLQAVSSASCTLEI